MKVKKWLLGLVTFAAMAVLCAVCAGAEKYGDYLYYSVLDDGTVQITYCETGAEAVVIPDTIDGKSVASIGNWAFEDCTSLTSITIPDSVTEIGLCAFFSCSSLTSITIPDSVTSIGESAFEDCTSLKSITIPDSVTSIGDGAFIGCSSLTEIKVASENSNYVSVNGVLYNKDKTTIICYPAGKKGNNYKIPDGVTSIDNGAFEGCTSLTAIDVADDNEYYTSVDGVLFNKDKTELICYPAGKTDKSYNIPNSVTSIGWYAFIGCTSLTSITIPDGVVSIGEYAFCGCSSLTSITIPNGVTEIGWKAFGGCSSLTSITIPESVTEIGYYAFSGCTSLTSITIPNSVTSIGGYAFEDCSSLTSITIPDCVTSIGGYAFSGCTSLTSITIPDSVTEISYYAFSGCTNLTAVDVADDNEYYTSVDGVLFNKDKTELICYPDGKTDMSYNIPNSVTWIGGSAFEDCTSLTSITIPNSVTWIGSSAFEDCTSLTSITIPNSVTSIDYRAFYNCSSLTEIKVASENSNYVSVNGVLYNKDKTTIICYPAGKKGNNYKIPDGVTSISDYAFSGCTSLKSITIPDGVTEIGYSAFEDCTSLTSITIPNSVTSIDHVAFIGCTSLTSITIPNSVTSIGLYAFGYYDDNGYKKIDNFKIYCYSGTAGERYAKNYGFEYELLDHTEHTYGEWKTTKAATCTAEGTQTRTCEVCGKTETQTIKALGHTVVVDKAVAATCDKSGLTEGSHCSVCGEVIKAQETVPATGKHSFGEWKTTKAATCTAEGTQTRTCEVCGKTETQTIAKVAHKYVDTVVKPTYTAQGYTLHKCSVCGNSYKDTYTAKLVLAKITGVKLGGRAADALRVNWTKNASADGYIVEMYQNNKWVRVAKITSNNTTTFRKAGLKASTVYKFRVRAYKMSGSTAIYSDYSAEIAARTNPSVMTGAKLSGRAADALHVNWTKNASADGYIVEMYQGNKWVRVAKITSNSTTTFRKAGLKAGTVYKFRVRAYKMSGSTALYGDYSATVTAMTNPSVMTGAKLSGRAADALRINWSKNASADGYIVEMYQGNKWVRVAKITNNSTTTFRKAGLNASTVYKFRVRAYKMSGKTALYGNYSATVTARTNPSIVKGVKIAGKAKDALRVNWTKNTSAQGYIVEMYKGGKWVRVAKITNSNTTTFRKAGLAKNTAYKFRVCAYYMSGKTALYGNYGSVSGKTAAK